MADNVCLDVSVRTERSVMLLLVIVIVQKVGWARCVISVRNKLLYFPTFVILTFNFHVSVRTGF